MNNLRYLLLSVMIMSNSAKTSNFNLTADKNYIIPLMGLGMAAAIYYYWFSDLKEIRDEHYPDGGVQRSHTHGAFEEHGECVEADLLEIKDNKFDIKKYFSIIYELILAQKASQSNQIKVVNALYNERNLKEALNQRYANYDYLLLFYAHAPHSDYKNLTYPKDPLAHTSLILCEIDGNGEVKRVLNIDGFNCPRYVNPLSNQLIRERLVLKLEDLPLQKPTMSNMNCVLYAFTFAEKILDLIELQVNKRHALTVDLLQFEKDLLSRLIGTYIPLNCENKDIIAIDYHNKLRGQIAQAYLQSVGRRDKTLNSR